jgi:hypothetical protein
LDDGNTVIIRPKSSKKDYDKLGVAGLPSFEVQIRNEDGDVVFKHKTRITGINQPEE